MKKHLPLLLTLGLFANHLVAEESYTAKSLFFGEDASAVTNSPKISNTETPKKNKVASSTKKTYFGANHFINLKNADGSTTRATASRVFKSGEQFQLGVQVMQPSYLYVYNKASNGKVTLIYPSKGKENFVNTKGTVFLPEQGTFAFDNEPGNEELTVYVSQIPLNNPMQEIAKVKPDLYVSNDQVCLDDKTVAGVNLETSKQNNLDNMVASNDYASKGIFLSEDKSAICKSTGGANDFASKGIYFAEDDSQAESGGNFQHAGYAVKKIDSKEKGFLYVQLKLKHQ